MDSQAKSQRAALERLKKSTLSSSELWNKIIQKDKVALGQAISIIESVSPKHQDLADELILIATQHKSKPTLKIGVTGVPGVGKSTFINAYSQLLLNKGLSVAILAVDPSSQQSRGSILGDKTRMVDIFSHPDVFIRPSPSGSQLGGVASKTREIIALCEAAGYDRILVETVGVGQSEISVYEMTDVFLLLMLPGAGDELQGIKRGIMEMADILIVHKADGDNLPKAKVAAIDYKRALHMFPPTDSSWEPVVLLASSEPPHGLDEIHKNIEQYYEKTKSNGYLFELRKKQRLQWFEESLEHELNRFIRAHSKTKNLYQDLIAEVENQNISPRLAARKIVESFYLKDEKR